MSDLGQYNSQQDRIAELEAEVSGLRDQLRLCDKLKRKYKSQWRQAIGDHELPTDKARKLIKHAGQVDNVANACKRIAKEVGLKAQTVRALWYAKT